MKTSAIKPLVELKNLPEQLQHQRNFLEQYAKENNLSRLSVTRAQENKYLPRNDMYVTLAAQSGKATLLSGTDVFIVSKEEKNSTILEKILDPLDKATIRVKAKIFQEKKDS